MMKIIKFTYLSNKNVEDVYKGNGSTRLRI